jgi:hypothetical protein
MAYEYTLAKVEQEYHDVQDGSTLWEKIKKKLWETFSSPPTTEFETILRKNFTDDEVRVALFKPLDDQIR